MRMVLKQFCDSVALRVRACKPIDRTAAPHGAEAGLTLIEMLVVLVIIAIVGGLIVANVIGRPDDARITTARTDIRTISATLKTYRLDNGQYPTTEQGLKALAERPTAAPVPANYPSEPYLDEVPVDPWGNPYVYVLNGTRFELKSLGRDGRPGGEGPDADIDGRRP